MTQLTLNMFQTVALAIVMLRIGVYLRGRVSFFTRFCIPAPVIGGLICAFGTLVLYSLGICELSFEETLKDFFMVLFFTTVGFEANTKVLKRDSKVIITFLICVIILICCQNALAVLLAKFLGIPAAIGLCTGSIPMVGGHGTAGAFGPVLVKMGFPVATTVATAAATFGLVAASLSGGPVASLLIRGKKLTIPDAKAVIFEELDQNEEDPQKVLNLRAITDVLELSFHYILVAMGIGTGISYLAGLTGLTFPIYIGAMLAACAIRNIGEYTPYCQVNMLSIQYWGGISLAVFLAIAMISLKLWELADLALPLVILLFGQVILTVGYAYFVIFRAMGADYDAAVIVAGTCGFGMGATPNAMANMQALVKRYVYSPKAFFVVPIVGSMFADFVNSIIITLFINFCV